MQIIFMDNKALTQRTDRRIFNRNVRNARVTSLHSVWYPHSDTSLWLRSWGLLLLDTLFLWEDINKCKNGLVFGWLHNHNYQKTRVSYFTSYCERLLSPEWSIHPSIHPYPSTTCCLGKGLQKHRHLIKPICLKKYPLKIRATGSFLISYMGKSFWLPYFPCEFKTSLYNQRFSLKCKRRIFEGFFLRLE